MFCSKCGKQSEGASYCPFCGTEMEQLKEQTTIPTTMPRSSKRRMWAFIGIVAGAIIIPATALFFILTSAIEGQWYNKDRGEVLTFHSDGTMEFASLTQTDKAGYEYNRLSGQGSFKEGDQPYEFTAVSNQIDFNSLGVYKKAGPDFDVDDFIEEYGNFGTWYNEDRGEVLVFNANGKMQSIHASGTNEAVYEYDKESGKGTITLGAFTYKMQYDDGKMDITDMGKFTEAAEEFDTDKFLDEYGESMLGLWFDPKGEGAIDLHADGTYDLVSFGRNLDGKYTQGKNDVTITFKYFTLDIDVNYVLEDGVLKCEKEYENTGIVSFARSFSEQKGKEHFYDEAVGKWKAESIGITIELYDDCTGKIYDASTSYNCSYRFEPVGNVGYLSIDKGNEVLIMISKDILVLEKDVFYRTD